MSMPTNMSPSCHLLLHHLRGPYPPHPAPRSSSTLASSSSSSFLSLFFRPLSASLPSMATVSATFPAPTARTAPPLSPSPKSILRILASRPLFSAAPLTARSVYLLCHSVSSEAFAQTPLPHLQSSLDGDDKDERTSDIDGEEREGEEGELVEGIVSEEEDHGPERSLSTRPVNVKKGPGLGLNLGVKEKKELASYAHSLGKKLKCQLVGKSGVTDNVAASFIETLEANELLKIKIHRTCPGELDDVVNQLEALTGSVVVGQIGRTVIIYRPSLTKLKAEEKKKQAQRAFSKKRATPKPALVKDGQGSRTTLRARQRRMSL